MTAPAAIASPAIAVRELTLISPAGTMLLRKAELLLRAGEVVVIVGPSGSGKTSLIRLLCGLLEREAGNWHIEGTLRSAAGEIDLARQDSPLGGMVFQSHALFDDLNASENLRIVADHGGASGSALGESISALLADIEPGQSVMSCSGGQRQRLAIVRTLLADPALLVLDEPNSGLDIRSARWLVGILRKLCQQSGRPVIIVAHHIDELIELADCILLLDPVSATLREMPVDRAAVEAAMLRLDPASAQAAGGSAEVAGRGWARPLRRHGRGWWFLRYFGSYLWLLFAAPSMLLYTILGSAIVGFVTVWFGFNYHSFGGYLRAILHDETLEGLGFVLATVAVPFNTCILIIARNSAIIAADLGNRVSGLQFQAMRNLGLPGRFYIVTSIMLSLVLGSMALVAAALVSAFLASLVTWHYLFPGQPTEYWQENFFRKLMDGDVALVESGWITLKVTASALLGGGAAILFGLRPLRSPSQLPQLIASAIISSVSLTLLVHAVLLVLQF